MSNPVYSQLNLNEFELKLHLGWPEQERQTTQVVAITIKIRFSKTPTACDNDQLDDTICYDTLLTAIKSHCQTKIYRLIEHLACDIYNLLKTKQAQPANYLVRVHKIKVPIDGLNGGATFNYGDWRE